MKLPSNQISKSDRLKIERSVFKKHLKRGDLLKIATHAEVNVQVVYRWFSGKIVNSVVGPYIENLAALREKIMKENIYKHFKKM